MRRSGPPARAQGPIGRRDPGSKAGPQTQPNAVWAICIYIYMTCVVRGLVLAFRAPGIPGRRSPLAPRRSRNCGFLSGPKALTLVAYLSSNISIMCIIIDFIPVLALMPMPYYIFPNAFSGPKTRRGDVLSASLLHFRSRLPPCSAVLLRVPSAEAQCARAWAQVGVPVRLPAGLPLPSRDCSHNWTRAPLCVPRGLTQVCSVPPPRLHAAVAPHLSSDTDTEAPLSWALPKEENSSLPGVHRGGRHPTLVVS
jgi:hypothetical protein